MLRFAEEIMLLLLDENGRFSNDDRQSVDLALAGGVLMDLALESRIDTDMQKLVLLDAEPTGDALLDATLADIAAADRTHDARYWVDRIRGRADEIRATAIARLVARGTVVQGGFLKVFRRRYVLAEGNADHEIKRRIIDLVTGDDIPDPRDVVIIALSDVCGLFARLLTDDELDRAYGRIEQIGRMDLIGQAVMALLQDAEQESSDRLQFLISQGMATRAG